MHLLFQIKHRKKIKEHIAKNKAAVNDFFNQLEITLIELPTNPNPINNPSNEPDNRRN